MQKEKIWKTALYIRLSQEDEKNNDVKRESNSITNQKNRSSNQFNWPPL